VCSITPSTATITVYKQIYLSTQDQIGTMARETTSSSSKNSNSNGTADDANVLLELMSPDGYYRYLGVTKPSTLTTASTDSKDASSSSSSASSSSGSSKSGGNARPSEKDEQQEFIDSVKKSYRKLSLKHHPDKSGGNVDTFRLLNRAQRVLMDTTLRKQYDLLGIDLDDDDENVMDHSPDTSTTSNDSSKDDKDHHGTSSSPQGVLQEIASNILAGVLQLGVRTSTFSIYVSL
jgi:DnaJ domain